MGNALFSKEDYRGAVDWYNQAIALGKSLQKKGASQPSVDANIATIARMLSSAHIRQNQISEASEALAFAASILEELRAKDPKNLEYARRLAYITTSRGDILHRQGKAKDSLAAYQEALALRKQVAAASGASLDQQLTAFNCYKLGLALERALRKPAARETLQEGKKILLDLRATGQLSDASEGLSVYLPGIEKALSKLPK